MYCKPAKTRAPPKDEAQWNEGVWIGFMDESNEHIVGTSEGIAKCRAIRRHDESERFDVDAIRNMTGFPWAPAPGRTSLKIPTNIEENGAILNDDGDVEGYHEEEANDKQEVFKHSCDEILPTNNKGLKNKLLLE